MATSLALILLLGMTANYLFSKFKLPGLLGMLLIGVALGPFGLDLLDESLMMVSSEFRKMALIVILLRAGLGISRDDLNAIGGVAIRMSFIPGILEGFAVLGASMMLFNLPFLEAGILGFIIAAVSPAVIVPYMLRYKSEGYGTDKRIPTMILAGASVDDVFAITIFSTFLGLSIGGESNVAMKLLGIPVSILVGISIGIIIGFILVKIFEKYHIRDTKKVMMILGIAIMLTALENALKSRIEIAGLLSVMAIGFILLEKRPHVAKRLSIKLNKIWLFAEILLFVLVGAQVNVVLAWDAGALGLLLIAAGLFARSLGVIISTIGTNLNRKERMFSVIAYWPKATVQAAIGAVPLAMGVANGELILALAVLSIVVTAPLGAIALDLTHKRLLVKEPLE
ncbi:MULTISPECIES: sodium:proton antiporter [unclassified Fusibacter]|uniref:cation:proton antiporter n=1 Tax=unclassified Fusibacter TaxID=2624464 RepID=UPI001011FEC6|nr:MULTISPECIES: cation:proton antiporter [unclassified Fusibacter]MCK8059512.1 cation:proton antiporter [Fusibacter sp. A2]NPE21024.1 sodium:proton antiporter [Fusibacter sp. A1]RXV62298.1 sodium:proton antiporter [Fusibacter sp. A1]